LQCRVHLETWQVLYCLRCAARNPNHGGHAGLLYISPLQHCPLHESMAGPASLDDYSNATAADSDFSPPATNRRREVINVACSTCRTRKSKVRGISNTYKGRHLALTLKAPTCIEVYRRAPKVQSLPHQWQRVHLHNSDAERNPLRSPPA
jgi:hypothetical protein